MNVNFEAIEKAWFKPKNNNETIKVLEKLEEDIYFYRALQSIQVVYAIDYILDKIQELKKENENG